MPPQYRTFVVINCVAKVTRKKNVYVTLPGNRDPYGRTLICIFIFMLLRVLLACCAAVGRACTVFIRVAHSIVRVSVSRIACRCWNDALVKSCVEIVQSSTSTRFSNLGRCFLRINCTELY